MKVLHVTADWKWTGPAEPMLHAVSGLHARGHEVDVAFPEAPPEASSALAERARQRGLEPVHVLARARGFRPLRDRKEVRRLREALRRGAYDVVHAHHTRDHLLARWARRGLATRLVASWHHGEPIPPRPWTRALLGPRGADGLAVLSPRIAMLARARLGWPEDRVAVVPGSVDTAWFQPRAPSETLRAELGLREGELVAGVVARLQPHRRFDLLLEAFARARREAPGLRLLVVGRGTRAREVLDEPARRLGLGDAVVRAGYRRDDYRDVLALLDVLVFLVPGSDGSCRAVLEAMAMERPVIASRRGVLPETVADGRTGRLVDEEPASLAQALVDAARAPERWRALGKAARTHVLAHHSIAHQAERLERLYLSVTRR